MHSKSNILSLSVDKLTFKESLQKVVEWGLQRNSAFVCFANVHMTIEAYKDCSFREDLQKATLVLPDGKPLAVACKLLYKMDQERIAGMDFMPALLREADRLKAKVFLFGSTDKVLENLKNQIKIKYPGTELAGAVSPPFKKQTEEETEQYIQQINDSGAHFVFVALGCPKQEKWMAAHYKRISAVLLGVGGAFPVMAGIQKRSPKWMNDNSLEWLFRLMQEPKRLFKRYLVTNTYFILLLGKQVVQQRCARK